MRVLWLIDSLNAGGAETLVPRFVRAARGLDVEVAFLKEIGGNPVEPGLRATGVPVHALRARHLRDVAALGRLVRLLRAGRYDVVHAHLTYASIFAALAARLTGTPVVATLHVMPVGPEARRAERARQWLMCRLLRSARCRVLAVSEAVRSAYAEAGLLDARGVEVVPNGIELDSFDGAAPSADRAAEDRDAVVVTCVSVLRPGKGLDVLLSAAVRAALRVPALRVWIAGDGPLRAGLEQQAADLGLDGVVRWLGHRDDVASVLAASDVVVVPSREDALPTVVMEAMAAGRAVVASRTGGIPELVGGEGVLVPPGDPAALADVLVRLAQDPAQRRVFGHAAARAAHERFAAGTWVRRLAGVYAQAAPRATGWVGSPQVAP